MALLPNVFNADKHEGMGFNPVPKGKYKLAIVKSELKPTSAGDGKRLLLQFKILEGEYAKRIIFVGLNIVNPNDQAVEIAYKELKTICDACGKAAVEDSQELHNIPMMADVGIRPAKDGYPEQNTITMYHKLSGTSAPGASPFAKD